MFAIFIVYHYSDNSYNKKTHRATEPPIDHFKTLNQDLDMAKRVQEGLLTIETDTHPGLEIAKRCIPAADLGGDFYTFIEKQQSTLSQKAGDKGIIEFISGHKSSLGIAIGDVAGHGVSSALVMALSAGIINKIGQSEESPSEVLQRSNNDIFRFISNSQISHLTAIYASIDLDGKCIHVSNAGHPSILKLDKNKSIEYLHTEGTFLGLYKDEKYEEKTFPIKKKDRLFFYTDGITETKNEDNNEFGLKNLEALIIENSDKPIQELLDIIFSKVTEFREKKPSKDDQTMIIIEIK